MSEILKVYLHTYQKNLPSRLAQVVDVQCICIINSIKEKINSKFRLWRWSA